MEQKSENTGPLNKEDSPDLGRLAYYFLLQLGAQWAPFSVIYIEKGQKGGLNQEEVGLLLEDEGPLFLT
jgi:hypothetical protein